MSDALPTVWEITPHTRAKHAILERYLGAWFPILSNQAAMLQRQFGTIESRRILYIDGFAGPGIYKKGEPGSPVIALRAAVQHSQRFPFPVEMLFIEQRQDRYQKLCEVLRPELESTRSVPNVNSLEPIHGDCAEVLGALLDQHETRGIRFGPALAFLDQFGYGAVSMDLIRRILSFPQCEVFTYLDYKDMNRWITDASKSVAFDRAYGGGEWRRCVDLPESQRRSELLRLYKRALRERGSAQYVAAFLMFDRHNMPLYWLLFCTNSLRGFEEMKKAMWHVDKKGSFKFSDQDNPQQLTLLDIAFSQDWLANELRENLAGRTWSITQVKEYVLTETPCYLFRSALKHLETGKEKYLSVVKQPAGRKPGTYPEEKLGQILVKFSAFPIRRRDSP